MNLEEIRTEIDALDKELLALFERRMDLCRDVALYKKEHNLPVFQPEREEKLLDKIEQAASPDRKHAARTLFSVILDISKQLQSRILAKMETDPIFPVPNFLLPRKSAVREQMGQTPKRLPSSSSPAELSPSIPPLSTSFRQWNGAKSNLGCCLFIIVPAVRSHQHTTYLESTIAILLP